MVRNSKSKKDLIILTSAKLFAERGYHNTKMRMIAKSVGLCQSTLYHYIRGKKQIMDQIINANMFRMEKVIRISESELTPKEKLRELIKSYVGFSTENAYESRILFTQTNILPPKMRRNVRGKMKLVEDALQKVLRDGVNQGEFSMTLEDVKITSFAILGICHWTFLWYRSNGESTPDHIAKRIIELLENPLLVNN